MPPHSNMPAPDKEKATGLVGQPLENYRRRLLLLSLLGIALLADFAGFDGFLAAGMRAGFALGFRLVAAGFRTRRDRAEHGENTRDGNE